MEITRTDHHGDDTTRLYHASVEGSIASLNALIQKDPLILRRVSLTTFSETPLHVSALLGHLEFFKILLTHNPKLATELDSSRRLPLHLASAEGHKEVVQALLYENPDACLHCDQQGRVPLHYAAMRGRLEVVKELMREKPESIAFMDESGGTSLHLCVQHNHLECLEFLVKEAGENTLFFKSDASCNTGITILRLALMLKQTENHTRLNFEQLEEWFISKIATLQKPFNCHDEESFALLQFKQSFIINTSASYYDGAYPKVSSWKPTHKGENNSCCSWDGVECNEKTGNVIGLDLSSSCLYGSINSNSSLFRLVHLQRLNLADNHFNYSQIPTTIRNFPSLTQLDLSASFFSGRVPSELSQLVKLSSLNLSHNTDPSGQRLLKLDGSNFRSLVQNLTNLQMLHLSFINISSPVPDSMANLSFLTSLLLRDCGIFGEFPVRIFKLQNLKFLSVRFNQDLIGHVPEFNRSCPLMSLLLASTSFSGNLPSTIEKLDSLNELDVSGCSFSGVIPFSLGNLKQLIYLDLSENSFTGPIPASLANLTQLTLLSLSMNNFIGGPLSWVGKQTKLTSLYLEDINLSGCIPSSLGNLTQLTYLYLRSNNLRCPIPSLLGNLSRLVDIDLSINSFNSSIPESLFNLMDLEQLSLFTNDLHGKVDICRLQSAITILDLGRNKLEVSQCTIMNTTQLPKFSRLVLRDCNLEEFPDFLRHQQNLMWLDLGENNIHGQIPKWIWNTSIQNLELLDISENFLSGFGQSTVVVPWVNLQVLLAAGNLLEGSLPIPPQNIIYYDIHDNKLTGEISPSMCNLRTLQYLHLSNNKLSGTIPQCIGNFSDHLTVLLLGNNLFHGTLPQTYTNKSNLRVLDVSQNQLQGKLPRSLANCLTLENLILSNNNFNDVFPFWLRTLPELKLLAMRHNGFLGVIRKPENNQVRFPKLRILDLSYNNFTGKFLAEYIFSEYAMRSNITVNLSTYMEVFINYGPSGSGLEGFTLAYSSKITIMSKGVDRYYSKLQEAFAFIDISSNKFGGKIDEWIGNLNGLWSLNVSNNLITGGIPSSLGNLTLLESLDVSNNKLSGEIPQQLAQLTFLSQFNVSHNNLTGPIPRGTQLMGFNVTSYEGNSGLCGDPLPKKCGNSNTPAQLPASRTNENDLGSGIEFDWIFVLAGFGSGFVVGVVLANVAITRRHALFLEVVGILIRLMERITSWKRFGHRN